MSSQPPETEPRDMPSTAALSGDTDFSRGRQIQPKEPEKWPQIIFRCSRPDWGNPRRSLVKHSVEAGSVHSTKTLSRSSSKSSWVPLSLKKSK